MITKYATPPNNNEITLQMIIDDEAQTIKVKHFLFVGAPDFYLEKSIMRKIQAATDTPEKARAFFSILALIGG